MFFFLGGIDGEVSARPRRMSEFNITTKIQPIPPGTSFFIFSQNNRLLEINSCFLPVKLNENENKI